MNETVSAQNSASNDLPAKQEWQAPKVVELDMKSVKSGPGDNEQFTPNGNVSSGGNS